jgi:hypothetical protein
MVFTGNYLAYNFDSIVHGLLSWDLIIGTVIGLFLICLFLFIDWRKLLEEKKISVQFNIWK